MNLSIVILTCNQKALTERCLQSIYDLTLSGQIEIIVIDNGSTDDTDLLISNKYPRVIYHRNDKNNGVASGRNLGVTLSRGTMIMLLDNDTIAEPSTILEMLDYINEHSDIGLLAPCLISPSGQIQRSFKPFPGIGIKLKNFLSHGQASQYVPLVPDTPIEPFYVIGAAQLFSRHLFNLIGGLDSRIFYARRCRLLYGSALMWPACSLQSSIHNNPRLATRYFKTTFYTSRFQTCSKSSILLF